MPELTSYVLENGIYETYWKYDDMETPVQENTGITNTYERYENGGWVTYSETVSCSYSLGNMRIKLQRSDFWDGIPNDTWYFRTVILY
jgi:hypothetical protein